MKVHVSKWPICMAALLAGLAALPALALPKPHSPSKIPYAVALRAEAVRASFAASGRSSFSPQEAGRISDRLLQVDEQGRLRLFCHAADAVGPAEKASLENLGATIIASSADSALLRRIPGLGMVAAWIPSDRLDAVAALGWVTAVTAVETAATDVGSVLSEGVALHGADVSHNAGTTGTGVAVGVISDGVTHLADAVATGDLPNTVNVRSVGHGDEGTAMLEIVHDMSPGSALLFASGGSGGALTFAQTLEDLADQGAQVVAEDLAYDTEPAFQQGIAATTSEMIGAGVSIHSSAGNLGAGHAERVRAQGTGQGPDGNAGPFTGCTKDPLDVVDIDPGAGTAFDVVIPPMANYSIVLQWSEPRAVFPSAGAGAFTDLDLYLMDAAGTTCLKESLSVQGDGAGDSLELISGTNGSSALAAKIVVNHAGGHGAVAAPLLDLRWRQITSTDPATRAGSLNPDSNYLRTATSAAAVEGTSATPQAATLRPYSAGGPVLLEETTVCAGAAYPCPCLDPMNDPCPQSGTAPQSGSAPNWAGADGVSVSGAGGFHTPFFGTSAAAPHTAACAALAWQSQEDRHLDPTAAKVQALLSNGAIDRGAPGVDDQFGAGVLDCRFQVPQMLVLLDRTGSMMELRPSTGNTRCEDALVLAKQDVASFIATSPTGKVAVWTFAGVAPTDLTGGFVDPQQALAALGTLAPTGCTGNTPLADAICSASTALSTAFPDLNAADRLLAISSDGGENASSGPCSGPSSSSGPPYDAGSWQRKVSDQLQGQNLTLTRFWGSVVAFGRPDVETGLPISGGIDDGSFFRYLADRSGGSSVTVDDEDPLPPPIFGPAPGGEVVVDVPALDAKGLAILAALLAGMALVLLRRQP